jgi:hypothetical protein
MNVTRNKRTLMSFISFKIKQLTSQVKTFNFLPFIFQNLIFKHFYSQFWFARSEFVIICTRKTEMLISLLITIYLWIFYTYVVESPPNDLHSLFFDDISKACMPKSTRLAS